MREPGESMRNRKPAKNATKPRISNAFSFSFITIFLIKYAIKKKSIAAAPFSADQPARKPRGMAKRVKILEECLPSTLFLYGMIKSIRKIVTQR